MQYEVIKGRINGKVAGELVELDEEVAESYGEDYVKPIEWEEEDTETKSVKKAKNKALSNKDTETKDEQGGTDQ